MSDNECKRHKYRDKKNEGNGFTVLDSPEKVEQSMSIITEAETLFMAVWPVCGQISHTSNRTLSKLLLTTFGLLLRLLRLFA